MPRNSNTHEYLIQRYVDNPILVQNKKFDIRLYILIKGVDPIEAYLFEDGLARFCTVSVFEKFHNFIISAIFLAFSLLLSLILC